MERIRLDFYKRAYDICITQGFDALAEETAKLKPSKIMIISDSNVSPLYLKTVRDTLLNACPRVTTASFNAGEQSKHLETVQNLYDACINNGLDRKSLIVALGGGVVGDVAGFVSATYMRGIRFIQVPTSLLAQTDSSVGGKVGVDFAGCKNIVGAFKQPSLVYINTDTLNTLPEREFAAGMGEVIKYGFICDKTFLNYLEENADAICKLKHEQLSYIIASSCRFKAMVVSADETELGLRAILNFGHTIGHAIESAKNFAFLHGECVGLGMKAAMYIAFQRGYVSSEDLKVLDKLLNIYALPRTVEGLDIDTLFLFLSKDKKSENGIIKFILPNPVGEAKIFTDLTREELESGMKAVIFGEND